MFGFSRGQRNGLIVLGIIIILSLFTPTVFKYFKPKQSITFHKFEDEIRKAKKSQASKENAYKLFKFDPNTATETDLKLLGLNGKQTNQVINYRKKVGAFRSKKDFKKIYAIDSLTYIRLKSYINLPDSLQKPHYSKLEQTKVYKNKYPNKDPKYKKPKAVSLNINLATIEELQEIKGIGPTLSERIVKYRNALGGFINLNQLTEVYGIEADLLSSIEKNLYLKNNRIKKLKINYITAKELEKHPYFSKNLAKELVKNRSFNGRYNNLKDLEKRLKIESTVLSQVKDYIEF